MQIHNYFVILHVIISQTDEKIIIKAVFGDGRWVFAPVRLFGYTSSA